MNTDQIEMWLHRYGALKSALVALKNSAVTPEEKRRLIQALDHITEAQDEVPPFAIDEKED